MSINKRLTAFGPFAGRTEPADGAMACFAGGGVGSIEAARPAGDIVTEFSTEAATLLRAVAP